MRTRGNCYVASEALYHILGGKAAGCEVYRARCASPITGKSDTHWWITMNGMIIDPSRLQFPSVDLPYIYQRGIRTGFLTKQPSKRARALMEIVTWQSAE